MVIMPERFQTLHPDPTKNGVRIERDKYEQIRDAIMETVNTHGEVRFRDLTKEVEGRLAGRFDGSVPWYVTTVKLDLEARGEIERVPRVTPQRLRIKRG
jgi:hypothetical protein